MKPPNKSFFRKPPPQPLELLSYISSTLITILLTLTILSRLGVFNLVGVSIILTESMKPVLRPGDIVVYVSIGYREGDIVTYCITTSHCIVHRVIGFKTLNTVNGNTTMVITKGDNVDAIDDPVDPRNIRGRVALRVPREIWIPILVLLLIYSTYRAIKTPVLGYTYIILFITCLTTLVAVYATSPLMIEPNRVKQPVINLKEASFDPNTCYILIRYVGELYVTKATVTVNNSFVEETIVNGNEVMLKPIAEQLGEAFRTGKPLLVEINASLNHIGNLKGEYSVRIGGLDPEIRVDKRELIVTNPNCFPIQLTIIFRYMSGGEWGWLNTTYIVDGFSTLRIEPPVESIHPYVTVRWFNQGVERWVGLTMKND